MPLGGADTDGGCTSVSRLLLPSHGRLYTRHLVLVPVVYHARGGRPSRAFNKTAVVRTRHLCGLCVGGTAASTLLYVRWKWQRFANPRFASPSPAYQFACSLAPCRSRQPQPRFTLLTEFGVPLACFAYFLFYIPAAGLAPRLGPELPELYQACSHLEYLHPQQNSAYVYKQGIGLARYNRSFIDLPQ